MTALERVATIYDPEEAHVARSFLVANGVDAYLPDAQMLSNDWPLRIALGGHRVLVPRRQANRARELLASVREKSANNGYEVDGLDCAACGNSYFRRVKTLAAGVAWYFILGVPLWWNTNKLRCANCGRVTESPEEDEE